MYQLWTRGGLNAQQLCTGLQQNSTARCTTLPLEMRQTRQNFAVLGALTASQTQSDLRRSCSNVSHFRVSPTPVLQALASTANPPGPIPQVACQSLSPSSGRQRPHSGCTSSHPAPVVLVVGVLETRSPHGALAGSGRPRGVSAEPSTGVSRHPREHLRSNLCT